MYDAAAILFENRFGTHFRELQKSQLYRHYKHFQQSNHPMELVHSLCLLRES